MGPECNALYALVGGKSHCNARRAGAVYDMCCVLAWLLSCVCLCVCVDILFRSHNQAPLLAPPPPLTCSLLMAPDTTTTPSSISSNIIISSSSNIVISSSSNIIKSPMSSSPPQFPLVIGQERLLNDFSPVPKHNDLWMVYFNVNDSKFARMLQAFCRIVAQRLENNPSKYIILAAETATISMAHVLRLQYGFDVQLIGKKQRPNAKACALSDTCNPHP